MESNLHKLIPVLILLLTPIFKNFDWERFDVADCNQSVTRQTELTFVDKATKNEQKINFTPTSDESNLFYSVVDNNLNKRKLTVEQIRSNRTFANISDENANEIIEGLYKMSLITYNIYKNGTGKL